MYFRYLSRYVKLVPIHNVLILAAGCVQLDISLFTFVKYSCPRLGRNLFANTLNEIIVPHCRD